MTQLPDQPKDLDDLRRISAEFGRDKMHIQGAGGNASIKADNVMWIKASGTLLADAQTRDVFVATDLAQMRTALVNNDLHADKPADFLLSQGCGLRPSIETSLHAVFQQRVVLHTHCIYTLAHAVRQDAQAILAEKLAPFDWAYVDYAKPGANLARSVRNVLAPETNVIVLGNHGLIVAADSVQEVRALQLKVHEKLSVRPTGKDRVNLDRLRALALDSDYTLPDDDALHQLAIHPKRVTQVVKGSLYPDHVIFCGIAVTALKQGETVPNAARRVMDLGTPAPVWILVPGAGVIVQKGVETSALVMMRCLADVIAHVPPEAELTYLSPEQNNELLNWDAEKYRQQLNAE
ncbi:MAG: class II aldolase/adducin family protein [Roseobacter sp.]